MPGLGGDDLGARMGRRNSRARNARETIDQAVEPTVIEGFQIHDVLIDKHLGFDDRQVHPAEAWLGLHIAGRSSSRKLSSARGSLS